MSQEEQMLVMGRTVGEYGEVRKKLGIGAAAKAEVPEVPASGPAEAKEAVKGRR